MLSPTLSYYWRASREPRYSLTFALPLLLLYEVLAFSLSHGESAGVRNGADVLLKSLFLWLGGQSGLVVLGVILVGGAATLVWRDRRRSGPIEPRWFGWMAMESVAYALLFGLVAGTLTGLLLSATLIGGLDPANVDGSIFSLPVQLMISLGAGIYEELLFRVLLVSGLFWLGRKVFRRSRSWAGLFAAILGALIFAAFHYIGPYGDRLELASFTFRTVAGLLFSGLYLLRGFGITAWTHALYDIFLAF
jgi:membrane protease YdiL (CAAX protease family)